MNKFYYGVNINIEDCEGRSYYEDLCFIIPELIDLITWSCKEHFPEVKAVYAVNSKKQPVENCITDLREAMADVICIETTSKEKPDFSKYGDDELYTSVDDESLGGSEYEVEYGSLSYRAKVWSDCPYSLMKDEINND